MSDEKKDDDEGESHANVAVFRVGGDTLAIQISAGAVYSVLLVTPGELSDLIEMLMDVRKSLVIN